MEGVRRVSRSVLRYLAALLVLFIVLQVYLAGEGIFGARDNDTPIDDANTLDLHRDLGWVVGQLGAILLLIVALLAWLPNVRRRVISIVLPFLLFIQVVLPEGDRWVAGLHAVNALLVLGLLGYLASALWRDRGDTARVAST